MLVNREVILVKIEGTYNVDPTPVGATDAILVEEPSWANEGARMNERAPVRQNIGKLKQVYGGSLRAVSFTCEVRGSGTAGTPPEVDPLLRACAMGVTNSPGTSDTYAPVSTGIESCTIYYYQDGTRHILTGCRGNVTFAGEAGALGKMTFNMVGHIVSYTDQTIATPTYDSSVGTPFIGASFTIDSFAAVISALAFDLSNTIATPPSVNASDGYGDVQITARDVQGSFDPEAELVADEAFIANWSSGAAMALTTGVVGSSAGNRWQLDMPAVSYREIAPGDRDGVRTYDITFGATESSGDDDVSIIYT